MNPASSDADLVTLSRQGDALAFTSLVSRHRDRVRAIAVRMMRDPVDAQDVSQEAFFSAFRNLDRFRGDVEFGSWLSRIATNACLMRMRTRRRRPEVPLHAERPLADRAPLADVGLERRELGQVIFAAIAALPEPHRVVVELADLEHRSMREIADHLGLNVPNEKSRLYRARSRLRSDIAEYLRGGEALAA